ncbi:endo-1,4-beta-xylanase [Corynebacterium cystitidis]|uniref:endo-1,4-beta-xylanase n=1 Tax=Corynebacterium cystitidis TaxID=35757 RepID=UPI00211EAD52|nr:endo-1,4-beta-xylanase [Corynebacterium cystitidis]
MYNRYTNIIVPAQRREDGKGHTIRATFGTNIALLLTLALAFVTTGFSLPLASAQHNSLRSGNEDGPLIGTAVLVERDLLEEPDADTLERRQTVKEQFDIVTPENEMKWLHIHPGHDQYDFTAADAIVEFAQHNNQQVRGHTLLWHHAVPQWVREDSKTWTCNDARRVMKDHVDTVVGRYAGRIHQWDVTNEILTDWSADKPIRLRTDTNPFLKACADEPEDFIADLFHWVHTADPDALLFMNDFNLEPVNAKSTAYYELAKRLRADGVPVHGVGTQSHLRAVTPLDDTVAENFKRFEDLGMHVAITELDVRVPTKGSEPVAGYEHAHTQRYEDLLNICLESPACVSLTVWGHHDGYVWANKQRRGEGWAGLMTESGQWKPAYYAMQRTLNNREGIPERNVILPRTDIVPGSSSSPFSSSELETPQAPDPSLTSAPDAPDATATHDAYSSSSSAPNELPLMGSWLLQIVSLIAPWLLNDLVLVFGPLFAFR